MEKDIVRLHGLIQYYESIGAWGLAQALRKVLTTMIIGSALLLSACATTERRTWHVHPDDMSQFNTDQHKCVSAALAYDQGDEFVQRCLLLRGYRMKVTSE